MRTRYVLLIVVVALVLAALACIPSVAPEPTNTPIPPPPPTERPTNTPEPTPVTCESLDDRVATVPIILGESYSLEMPSSTGYYPSNCVYYCMGVPSNLGTVRIGVTDFSVDLNLYIGRGSINVLNDVDIEEGSDWYSHTSEDGTDESVSISGPTPDVYYIEVCSYDGRGDFFTLWTEGN